MGNAFGVGKKFIL